MNRIQGEHSSGAIPLNEPHDSAVELASKELDFRREKQWNIFSWCSTTLAAITGGAIALQIGPQPRQLLPGQRWIISLAVVVLAAYAVLWLSHNWKMEKQARSCFNKNISEKVWGPDRKHNGIHTSQLVVWVVGYRVALVVLAVAALLAIWCPC